MEINVKTIIIAMVFVAFLASTAAAVPIGSLNQLMHTSIFSSEKEVKVSLHFQKSPDSSKLRKSTNNKSILIDIPKSYIKPARQTLNVEDSLLDSIEFYQYKEDVVRVRFVLNKRVAELKDTFSVSAEKENLNIFIRKVHDANQTAAASENEDEEEKAKPKPKGQETPNPKEPVMKQAAADQAEQPPAPSKESADAILASVIPKNPNQDLIREATPARIPSEPIRLEAGVGNVAKLTAASPSPSPAAKALQNEFALSGATDLFAAAFKIAIVSAILLAALIMGAYALKRWLPSRTPWAGKDKLIKVLAQSHIGPKKSIVLVQIGSEELVLGVAGDAISLLARLEKSASRNGFEDHLERASNLAASEEGSDDTATDQGDNGEVEQSLTTLANSIRDRISRLKKI